MKNLVKFLVPAAVAALALVSCNKEDNYAAPEENAVTIRVHASADALKGDDQETKTYIDANKTILWGADEYMKLCVSSTEGETSENKWATSDALASQYEGASTAQFEFSVSPQAASQYKYQGLYPASAAATSSNTNPAQYKVNLPTIQNATASSYDPAAYIMVAMPEDFTTIATDWDASFLRATALNKMTLKNVPDGVSIKRVKITAAGKKLAGGRHFNLTTGEGSDVYGNEATIEVHFATPLSGTNVDVWFTSWDAVIDEGETLTVVAYTTDKKSYSKEITVPAGRRILFQEQYLNTLGVSLSGITAENVTEFEAGDYVVLAKSGSDYFALKAEKESGKERLLSVEYTGNLDAYNGDAELVWTITKSGDSFIFENDSKYLGYKGSSNESYWLEADTDWTEDNYLLDVTPQETVGQYYVTVHSNGARHLSKNSNDPFFAFYGNTGQKADIVFVPATVDTRTPVTLSFADDAINKTTANYSEFTGQTATATPSVSGITYAIDGDNIGTITAATGAVVLNGNTGSATVTATFAGDATYRPASASYTITVASASGPVYTKVTALSDVTAGTYVIVNDGYYLPNAAATSAGPVKNNNTKVTVSGNNLSGVTDEMTWSFTGSASAMTIQSTVDSDYYLIVSGNGNNNLRVNTTSNHTWTISDYSGTSGAFSLKDNSQNRYCASYGSGSDWRSYNSYNAGNYGDGGRIYLYKLDDSSVTPTVATPTFSFVSAGNKVSISCATDGATIYYTTNGDDPTTSSNVYSEAISLSGDQMTIKAFATKSSYDDSAIASTTYYAINRAATTNGSIFANDYAAEGDEVTITVTPDSGYTLGTLSVTDSSSNAVSVSSNSFTMPASSVTISATFNLIAVTIIADALSAPGTYEVPDVLVYAVKGNALILGDSSGKIYAFKSSHGLSVGDVRTVSGSTIWYNSGDVYEFDSPTFSGSGTSAVNHGTAIEFADNAATLQTETGFVSTGSGAAHSAVYVHAIGVQSGRNITTSNGKVLYLSANENATDGKTVEVYGYVYAYSASHTNFNFLATSIEEDTTTPTISVSPASLSWAADETDTKNLTVTLNGGAAVGDYEYSVTSGTATDWNISDNGSGTITVSPKAANSSTTAAKSITLRISHADDGSVYQDVECSQGKAGNTTTTEEITSGTFSGTTASLSMTTSSGITITQLKGDGTNCNSTYNTVSTLRVYRANQMQFTGKTFTKIEMYYTGSYSGASWSVVAGGGTVTIDTTNKKVVWTNTSGASTVTLQNSTSSGTNTQLRTTKFYFEY